jgi:hypothetical protein
MAVAVGLAACTGVPHPPSPNGKSPAAKQSRTRPSVEPGPIRFILANRYRAGETVRVKIRNAGPGSFHYNSSGYEACNMSYFDSSGREFIIPPGTHCDLITIQEVHPGQTVMLFTWKLNECLKDNWGCVKAEPLASGRYQVKARFRSADGGPPARATASFTIVG